MPNSGLIAPLALYIFVMAITPGPNNMMLTSSGLIFGLRRTLPHMLGIPVGGATQVAIAGAGLGALFAYEPRLQLIIKILGSAYLLWLAQKLWRAASLPNEAEVLHPITFWQATLFQFANPKAWILVVTAVAAYTTPHHAYIASVLLVMGVFVLVTIPCATTWASFGAGLRHVLKEERWRILANRVMAAATAHPTHCNEWAEA